MYLNLDIHGRMVNVSIYHINHARLVVRLCVILCGISIETSVNLNLSLTSTCSFPIRLIWIRFCIFFNINNANECITNKRSIFIRHMLMMLLSRVRYFHSCVFFWCFFSCCCWFVFFFDAKALQGKYLLNAMRKIIIGYHTL